MPRRLRTSFLCVSVLVLGISLDHSRRLSAAKGLDCSDTTTRHIWHCVVLTVWLKVSSCLPGTQAATLNIIWAYRNSLLIPCHKAYVASMWHNKIYVDHCAMEGLSSLGNIRHSSRCTHSCYQISWSWQCPEIGRWFLFLPCPIFFLHGQPGRPATPLFYWYHIHSFSHGPSWHSVASYHDQRTRLCLLGCVCRFPVGSTVPHSFASGKKASQVLGQDTSLPSTCEVEGLTKGHFIYPWHSLTHLFCI